MKKKHLTADSKNNTKEYSSQNIQKPKIFLIKKIREDIILSSVYLKPFLILHKEDKNSDYNDGK
jgi:hypothetical protein